MSKLIVLISAIFLISCRSQYGEYFSQLRSDSPDDRAQAALFLGAQRVGEAIPYLRAALRDTVPQVRAKVIWALGMLRSKEALHDLMPYLRDAHRNVRQATALALMQIEEPEAISSLEAASRIEEDVWVKRDMDRAIQYLQQFEGETEIGEGKMRGEFY